LIRDSRLKNHEGHEKEGKFVIRILVIIAAALVLVILGGTVYAFFIRLPETMTDTISTETDAPVRPSAVSSGPADTRPGEGVDPGGGTAMFTGIGPRRIAAAGGEPATVLLSITFPYPGADRAFTEELVTKVPEFRSIVSAYFSTKDAGELRNLDEAVAKAELLRRFNAELQLGKIEVLYFNDFMILE
jgi:flagellar basal body-associated protein FliL